MKKFTLLIDMDGVVAQWYLGFLNRYRKLYPDRATIEPEALTKFYIEECYPREHTQDILRITKSRGFYCSLPLMPGAQEALKDIEENCLDFINPFICTAPEVEFEDLMCHSEKVQYVREHFGDFWVKQTIITKDKTLVRGDILIDDKPIITGCMKPEWDQLTYKQPYNEGRFTWSDWHVVRDIIKKAMFGYQ